MDVVGLGRRTGGGRRVRREAGLGRVFHESNRTAQEWQGHSLPMSLAWSPRSDVGDTLYVSNEDGTVSVLRGENLACKATLLVHNNAIFDSCLDMSGSHLATASGDETVHVTDVCAGRGVCTLMEGNGSVRAVAWKHTSPDILAAGSRGGYIHVSGCISRRAAAGLCVDPHRVHAGLRPLRPWAQIWDLRSAPRKPVVDGLRTVLPCGSVASAHAAVGRRTRGTSRGSLDGVTATAFGPGDCMLFTGGASDATVKIWDMR